MEVNVLKKLVRLFTILFIHSAFRPLRAEQRYMKSITNVCVYYHNDHHHHHFSLVLRLKFSQSHDYDWWWCLLVIVHGQDHLTILVRYLLVIVVVHLSQLFCSFEHVQYITACLSRWMRLIVRRLLVVQFRQRTMK